MANYNFSSTTYNWVELNGDGAATLLVGSVGDGSAYANPINLGSHVFNLYGTNITGTSLYGDTSGWLFVGGPSYDQAHTDLSAAPAAPCSVIAPLWNFRPGQGGYYANNPPNTMMWYKIDGLNRLIVEWNQVFHSPAGVVPFTFEVIIQLDTGVNPGDIIFQYKQLDGAIGSTDSTVGIKDSPTPGNFALSSFNAANPLVGVSQAILASYGTGPPVVVSLTDTVTFGQTYMSVPDISLGLSDIVHLVPDKIDSPEYNALVTDLVHFPDVIALWAPEVDVAMLDTVTFGSIQDTPEKNVSLVDKIQFGTGVRIDYGNLAGGRYRY
jgi:hypothetical protein